MPGAFTYGDTFEHAVTNAAEVLQLILAEYLDEGIRLPTPSFLSEKANEWRVAVAVSVTDELILESKCVSITDAANALGVTRSRISQMIDSGILDAVAFGNSRLVTLSSIKARKASPRRAGRPRKG